MMSHIGETFEAWCRDIYVDTATLNGSLAFLTETLLLFSLFSVCNSNSCF